MQTYKDENQVVENRVEDQVVENRVKDQVDQINGLLEADY